MDSMPAQSRRAFIGAVLTVGAVGGAGGVRKYHVRPQPRPGVPNLPYQPYLAPPVPIPVHALSLPGVVLSPAEAATGIAPAATTAQDTGGLLILNPAKSPAVADVLPGSALRIGGGSVVAPKVKVYQFIPTSLTIDHCTISELALWIYETGEWRLRLRADQNPRVVTTTATTLATVTTAATTTSTTTVPAVQIRGLPPIALKETAHLKRNRFLVTVQGLGAFTEPLAVPNDPGQLGKPALLVLPRIEFWVQSGDPLNVVQGGCDRDAKTFFNMIDRALLEFTYR
jgi:hypothetical protein